VYDNLVLFDRQGRIVAVSNPQYQEYCDKALGEEWVQQTLALQDGQSYTVRRLPPVTCTRTNTPTSTLPRYARPTMDKW